jgi:hypothetical protein
MPVIRTNTDIYSARMYKAMLQKWDFKRKVTHRDWQVAVVMLHQRKTASKETVGIRISEHTKTVNELRRHIKVHRVSESEFVTSALAQGITSSASVHCLAPTDESG